MKNSKYTRNRNNPKKNKICKLAGNRKIKKEGETHLYFSHPDHPADQRTQIIRHRRQRTVIPDVGGGRGGGGGSGGSRSLRAEQWDRGDAGESCDVPSIHRNVRPPTDAPLPAASGRDPEGPTPPRWLTAAGGGGWKMRAGAGLGGSGGVPDPP